MKNLLASAKPFIARAWGNGRSAGASTRRAIQSTWPLVWPIAGLVALVAAFLFAGYLDFTEVMHQPPQAVYEFPPMAEPCREPIVNKELRIWVDKRLSDTEGVRTCRVVPIRSELQKKSLFKDTTREGVRG